MIKRWIRAWRAFWYRRLPLREGGFHLKRLAGYERRWDLEGEGFTKPGFMAILRRKLLRKLKPGTVVELQAGDGLVGSLGVWLEQVAGWNVEAWEYRVKPFADLQRNRPKTAVHAGRLTDWNAEASRLQPVLVTTRGAREAGGVCRAVRKGQIRPHLVGIWNPTRRSIWQRRLKREGYRLELVYHRMEFFADARGLMPEDGGQGSGDGGQRADARRRVTDD
jgi:hypothetical protein